MPMTNPVIAGDALARGLRNEFANTWARRYEGLKERLSPVMQLGVQSTRFEELFGYFEVAPYPRRRRFGDEVQSESFRARNYAVQNHSWDSKVEWKMEDRLFDQLGDLERAARRAGENFATLAERVAFQLMQSTTDPDLLPYVPNAPDGAAGYSTVDGAGAARFGVTGGNILTGAASTGVATSQAVRNDFFTAMERFGSFLDPKGQPAVDPSIVDAGVTIYFGIANLQVFREAFQQGLTLGITGTDAAGVSNIILDSGMKVRLVPTSRITDDDWYLFLDDFDLKPMGEIVAMPLEEHIQTQETSDVARSTKTEGIFWQTIRGYFWNLPLATIKVDN